jgi:hypothetical protein
MTVEEYITAELEKLKQPIAQQDTGATPLEDAIFAKVMSKKFRKVKADQPAIDHAMRAIKTAISAKKPIKLTIHFGGNKLWRLDEAPEIDWGELFSLMFYVNWAKYVASVYEPGVIVEYFSMDVCVERMNNVPREETDQYSAGMKKLFAFAAPFIPKGVQVQYVRYGDLYQSRDEFYKELDAAKQEWLKDHGGKLPQLSEAKKAATELNVRLKPGQDKDPEWREKVEWEHQGIFCTRTGEPYMSDPTAILSCPTWYSGYVATGSTKRSLAKFWVGVGALERTPTGYNEIILTPKQLQAATFDWEDVRLDGLNGKNFKKIRVLK